MRRAASLLPGTFVVALAVVAALPWGVAPGLRFILSCLPVVAIIHFTLLRASLVPAPVAFAAGLVLDGLTYGPLGYWALINVSAQMLAALAAPRTQPSLAVRSLIVAGLLAPLAFAGWAIASLAFNEIVDGWPIVIGVGGAILAHPLMALLTRPLDRALAGTAQLQLDRGEV